MVSFSSARHVEQTSMDAFTRVDLNNCREQVLLAIRYLGESTDTEIASYLRWPINSVTPRRGELYKMGLVGCKGKKVKENGRSALIWGVQ